MSRGLTLRAVVNERLAAAAEDIFVLFERTIAEYEEDLCRSKEENQRKQQLLDKILIPWSSPGPGLNQKITETSQIKDDIEEQSIKQEEEQLPVPVPESSAVCVETEEFSLLQQRQAELRGERQGEDISSEPGFHSETEGHTEHSSDTDNDNDWGPFSRSAAQMETEADGDHYNEVQTRDRSTRVSPLNKSASETTVYSEHMSGTRVGAADRKKHLCSVCNKRFRRKFDLQIHFRVHSGDKPYSCSTCAKTFSRLGSLNTHERLHTGVRPHSCSFCMKTFAQKSGLVSHVRTHTGEKPYSCSSCGKHFADHNSFRRHKRTHTGERPYSCPTCGKTFTQKHKLNTHIKTYSCSKSDEPY